MTGSGAFALEPFAAGLGLDDDWRRAVDRCVEGLGPAPGHTLGLVYVSDAFASELGAVAERLADRTGVATWVGTVGMGVMAGRRAAFDEPAVVAMTAPLQPQQFGLFDCVAPESTPEGLPPVALVHVDPRNPRAAELVAEIARTAGAFLIGGLSAARGDRFDQVAGMVTDGGVSGVVFQPGIARATGLTQGCRPIGPVHTITEAEDTVIMAIDGQPALDVLRADLAGTSVSDVRRMGGSIFAGFPVAHSDTGDYLVRNLTGIDPANGWIAVGEVVEPRRPILFCRRDRAAAEADLTAMAARVRARVSRIRGAVYISCLGRGPHIFDSADAEIGLVQDALGDVPLVGFYANGEISHDRIYGYTGVLLVF